MSKKQENSIKCIKMGDQLFGMLRKEYISLKNNEKFLSSDELEKQRRILGAQCALVCEYYLKGLLLDSYKIDVSTIAEITQEDREKIKEILNNINEEEEYNLLIGNSEVLNELVRKFQLTKRVKNILSQQALKKFGGNGHHLGSFFEQLPTNVKNEIFISMEGYYSKIKKPISKEEWKAFLSGFLIIKDSNYEKFEKNKEELKQMIDESKISDAFINGRYGHFENYTPNLDALYYLAHAIRESVKKQFINAISLSDEISSGYNSITYIFPDIESKIYVSDDGKSLTRVYKIMKYEDFIKSYSEVMSENLYNIGYALCPEFGIKKMKEISLNSSGEKVILNNLTPLFKVLYVSPIETSIIVCTVNGRQTAYAYNKRKFYRNKRRIFKKVKNTN